MRLRGAIGGGSLPVNSISPLKHADRLPSLWQDVNTGLASWRSSLFPLPVSQQSTATCYLQVQSLPVTEVLFSLLWFVLQAIAFAIGAAVYWNRPFDRASQLFYALCLVTLGAFLGSNHWWIVSGSFWLTAPSLICTMLLPAVCLHFFLVFPRTWLPLVWRPRTSLALIYGLPVVGTAVLAHAGRRSAAGCRGVASWNRTSPRFASCWRRFVSESMRRWWWAASTSSSPWPACNAVTQDAQRRRADPAQALVAGGTRDDLVHDHGPLPGAL